MTGLVTGLVPKGNILSEFLFASLDRKAHLKWKSTLEGKNALYINI